MMSKIQELKSKTDQYVTNAALLNNSAPFGGQQQWEKLSAMPLDVEQELIPIGYAGDKDDTIAWPFCTKTFEDESTMKFKVRMPPRSRFILHGHRDAIENLGGVRGYIWGASTFTPNDHDSYVDFSLTDGETKVFAAGEWHWIKNGAQWSYIDDVHFEKSTSNHSRKA